MDSVFSLFGLKTTGISGTLTLTKTGTTARTATFPDASITVARTDAAQTFTGTQTFAAITATGIVSSQGLQNSVGDFTSRADEDAQTILGRIRCGFFTGLGDNASFAHYDFATSSNYALRQDAAGATSLNSASGQNTTIRVANTTVLTVGGSAITAAQSLTVPNGTAAAPGIRTTTYAHGLYSIGATSAGVSIAGTLALTVAVGGEMTLAATSTASTTAGALQREANQSKLYTFDNGIGGWMDKCIFSQYAAVTQSGVVTAQSLASATARGTRTLPANFFKVGKVIKFRLCGIYTTDVTAGNATLAITIGGTTIRTTGSCALDASITDGYWTLDGEFTCYSTGGSGTISGQTVWLHRQTGAGGQPAHMQEMTTTGAVTLDTTASGAFDVVWTADDAGTAITCTCFRLWEVC